MEFSSDNGSGYLTYQQVQRLTALVNQLQRNIYCLITGSTVKNVTINGNGGTTYSIPPNSNLILILTDGVARTSPQDYSYTPSTGAIVFTSNIDSASLIQEIYQ